LSSDRVIDHLAASLNRHFDRHPPLRVLDVGCGFDSAWSGFPIPDAFGAAHVVGMDLREADLRRNALLDEWIVGDVQSHPLPPRSFDAIVCWNVLEHVSDPVRALSNLEAALADGGTLVLGFPNVYSLKGLLTKLTPFRVHVWVYRRFFGVPNAGAPGVGPFRTYLRLSMSPGAISRFARRAGLVPAYRALYGDGSFDDLFPGKRALAALWKLGSLGYRLVTLGRLDPSQSEAVFVLQRPAGPVSLSPLDVAHGSDKT
jgi:SAM-dependent methyltransferase